MSLHTPSRLQSRISPSQILPPELCAHQEKLPLSLKLAFTAFMAVLVPVYWMHYGPLKFLYFCDLALLLTLAGVWLESPLLQLLWIADYAGNLAGINLTGMTGYMFDDAKPLYLRALSLFHGSLPLMLVYLVGKLGYDKRAFAAWTALAWSVMAISFFFLRSPETADAVANVNYVFGFSATEPQSLMPAWAWFTGMLVTLPVLLMAPVHVALSHWCASGNDKLKPPIPGFSGS